MVIHVAYGGHLGLSQETFISLNFPKFFFLPVLSLKLLENIKFEENNVFQPFSKRFRPIFNNNFSTTKGYK